MTDPKQPNITVLRSSAPVNEELVAWLESLTEKARAGELQSCNFAGTLLDGTVITMKSSTENSLLEIAAVSRLLHRLHVQADNDNMEDLIP